MFMIRLASAVALLTFWLATIGWTVLIVAAPANAETATTASSDRTASSPNKVKPGKHDAFPTKPHSPHEGHGHKGSNEPTGHPTVIWPALDVSTTS